MRKLSIEYITKKFMEEGYKLTTKRYINNKSKLNYICPENHTHSVSWNGWIQGHRCPFCSKVAKPDIDFIRKDMMSKGYTLLSDNYINAKSKLHVKCPDNHEFCITWSNWSNKNRPRRCPYCSNRKPVDRDLVKKSCEVLGYKLLSGDYINAKNKLHLVCPNGHDYYVSWDNWSSKSNRCPRCSMVGMSHQEKILVDFIKSCYDGTILENDRELIHPYELDIVIPNKKLAVEYCGLYWHSELMGKSRGYHLNKLNMCNSVGYKLLTVFEDELIFNSDIVSSVIQSKLNVGIHKKIYARNCIVKDIDTITAKEFCIQNHLQGYTGSSVKLGLFNDDNLVAVMTFSKPSISKGFKNSNHLWWEISRFCNKKYCQVIGGASKLLKYFENNYKWRKIFSYADRRWSDGHLYNKLGFSLEHETSPNYWYFSTDDYPRRRHRFGLRKNTYMKQGTEWSNRVLEGYNRIWDCGNLKFVRRPEDNHVIKKG